MKNITILTMTALAAMLLLQPSITLAAGQGPRRVAFKKCFVEDTGPFGGHYEGAVAGDCGEGTVLFTTLSNDPGPVVWRFSGYYTITTATCSFTALCVGLDNLRSGSGHDVLHGLVIEGDFLGAQVHVNAHDTDGGACTEGIITITPSK